jgi:6-phosphogluconolactonase
MIAADPSGKYVYSTDLGLDRIYQYRLDSQRQANAERSAVYRRLVAGGRPAPLRLYATGRRPVAD